MSIKHLLDVPPIASLCPVLGGCCNNIASRLNEVILDNTGVGNEDPPFEPSIAMRLLSVKLLGLDFRPFRLSKPTGDGVSSKRQGRQAENGFEDVVV